MYIFSFVLLTLYIHYFEKVCIKQVWVISRILVTVVTNIRGNISCKINTNMLESHLLPVWIDVQALHEVEQVLVWACHINYTYVCISYFCVIQIMYHSMHACNVNIPLERYIKLHLTAAAHEQIEFCMAQTKWCKKCIRNGIIT